MSILNKVLNKMSNKPKKIEDLTSDNMPDLSRFKTKSNINTQEIVDKIKPYTTPVPKASITLKKLINK